MSRIEQLRQLQHELKQVVDPENFEKWLSRLETVVAKNFECIRETTVPVWQGRRRRGHEGPIVARLKAKKGHAGRLLQEFIFREEISPGVDGIRDAGLKGLLKIFPALDEGYDGWARWRARALPSIRRRFPGDTEDFNECVTFRGLVSRPKNEVMVEMMRLQKMVLSLFHGLDDVAASFEDEHEECSDAQHDGKGAKEMTNTNREKPTPTSNTVFVVHGHDSDAVESLKNYLRLLRLTPLTWEEAAAKTENGASSSTLEIVQAGVAYSAAVLVLFTPDEQTQIRSELVPEGRSSESRMQPRPNVIFEAGLALAFDRKKVVLVQGRGQTKISDIDGLNEIRLSGSIESFDQLAKRLRTAGCSPSDEEPERLFVERFKALYAPAT